MLEKTEGTFGNEQYSDTGNIGHSTKRKKKKKNQQKTPQKYTQKTKKMSNTDPPKSCG